MTDISVITESDKLAAFCAQIADSDYITVDTEFLREKTYWSKLCLIQVACPGHEAIIDPLADGIDLSPFQALMAKPDLMKVFHACRQDLEIFYQMMGSVPTPVFDTQIAAMVLGHGDQIGYETLVNRLLNRSLDKSARFTDWSLRPLNKKQLAYALSDVTHLCDIYELFKAELDRTGRESWLGEEMKVLISPSTLEVDPDEAWRRIKSRGHNPRFLGVLKEIAAWREREAQARNLPKTRILRDEALLDVAGTKPRNSKELTKIRGVSDGFAEGKMGVGLLKAVERGLNLPDGQLPKVKKKERLPDGIAPLSDLLKVLLKHECERHQVAARIVASGDDLERIAVESQPDVPAMTGWRYEIFGKRAMELKSGKLAMSVRGRSIHIIELED
ncbi:ribonuclease D [Aestuariispira ectoiniformans]|uniref:ribonuclease D n=1 Tax=Aestuariispira ectoiniformans TaxID=2775080 RepID=UPI0028831618|nr:ribonuclease D [Aestuariispira ectoiniformans]